MMKYNKRKGELIAYQVIKNRDKWNINIDKYKMDNFHKMLSH